MIEAMTETIIIEVVLYIIAGALVASALLYGSKT